MQFQLAPMWLSRCLKNDEGFLTERDTRCLKVLLKRPITTAFIVLFASSSRAIFVRSLKPPLGQRRKSAIVDIGVEKNNHCLFPLSFTKAYYRSLELETACFKPERSSLELDRSRLKLERSHFCAAIGTKILSG